MEEYETNKDILITGKTIEQTKWLIKMQLIE